MLAVTLHTALALSLAAEPLALSPRLLAAQPAQAVPTDKAGLDTLYAQAQLNVERYNNTGDTSKLRVAHEELSRWLTGHAQLYGYGPEASQARAPVEQQMQTLEKLLGQSGTPVAATSTPAPPTAMSAEQKKQRKLYDNLTTWGLVSLSVGAGTLLFVSLPAWLLRERALDNASEERFYVEEQKYVRRARRRDTAALVSLGVGSALLGLGITFLAVGASGKKRLQRELAFAPSVGPRFAGATTVLRF